MSKFTQAVLKRRWATIGMQVLLGLAILGLWESVTYWNVVQPFALAAPWNVATYIGDWFRSGTIWANIRATLEVSVIGLAIGIGLGTVLGVLTGTVPFFRYYFNPFLAFFNAIPRYVIIPIFIVWLGFGNEPQIVIIVLAIVFLIALTVQAAITEIQGVLILNAKALGATFPQMLRTVYLPGVGIWIVSVARQSVGHAIVAACVVEFFGAQKGLGFLIDQGLQLLNTHEIYAAVFVASGVGLIADFLLRGVDRRIGRYLPQS